MGFTLIPPRGLATFAAMRRLRSRDPDRRHVSASPDLSALRDPGLPRAGAPVTGIAEPLAGIVPSFRTDGAGASARQGTDDVGG